MAGRRGAVLPQPALHRAALALGNARRRGAGAGGEGQPVPPARRQHPHLPPHDPPHGRRHRLGDAMRCAQHGLADNTLVVFTSDNGGERFSDNWPLVGGKMDLTEGGIRVPWIAHWPAVDRARRRQRPALHDDGLVGDACSTPPAWRPHPTTRSTACRCCRCCAMPAHSFARPDALAHEPPRPARAARRRLEVPAGRRPRLPVQHRRRRARARQPRAACEPAAADSACATPGRRWNATMPPIPEDATVSLGYSVKDMPQR